MGKISSEVTWSFRTYAGAWDDCYDEHVGTIAIACDYYITIAKMLLIACYIFTSKLNISMKFLYCISIN